MSLRITKKKKDVLRFPEMPGIYLHRIHRRHGIDDRVKVHRREGSLAKSLVGLVPVDDCDAFKADLIPGI